MAILTKKIVLTEKTSKMYERIKVEDFTGIIIYVTNNHAVLFYGGDDTKLFTVLTYVQPNCYNGLENIKATKFYDYGKKRGIDFDGLMYCGENNFITSGFREVNASDMDEDVIWLVLEKLCEYGSLISTNFSKYIENEMDLKELTFKIKNNSEDCLSILNSNSIRVSNREFWEKYPIKKFIGY